MMLTPAMNLRSDSDRKHQPLWIMPHSRSATWVWPGFQPIVVWSNANSLNSCLVGTAFHVIAHGQQSGLRALGKGRFQEDQLPFLAVETRHGDSRFHAHAKSDGIDEALCHRGQDSAPTQCTNGDVGLTVFEEDGRWAVAQSLSWDNGVWIAGQSRR